jgi:hypothetical protein
MHGVRRIGREEIAAGGQILRESSAMFPLNPLLQLTPLRTQRGVPASPR